MSKTGWILAQAVEYVVLSTVIPAAHMLTDISANSAHVAYLR